ncbi:unnamed protein product [Protopolystoma xenopodis]|uniref:Uncharacterized protein n=1 Tax=Protopolystoma xenopodis TaxID=117903 RepID=A0A3S5FDP0_9PLAT|nr:unnamed protein product [Protopolystoma xenopodis]
MHDIAEGVLNDTVPLAGAGDYKENDIVRAEVEEVCMDVLVIDLFFVTKLLQDREMECVQDAEEQSSMGKPHRIDSPFLETGDVRLDKTGLEEDASVSSSGTAGFQELLVPLTLKSVTANGVFLSLAKWYLVEIVGSVTIAVVGRMEAI